MAEYGSTHFQKPQVWKKTVLNGKTCQLSPKNSIGFYLAQSDDFFEWIKVQSQDLCRGSTRQRSKSCKRNRWCFRTWGINKAVGYLFHVLTRFRLCKGFSVVAKRTAKDARGNTVGTTEEWRSRDDSTVACTFAPLSATYYCKSTHAARVNCANRALRLKEIVLLPLWWNGKSQQPKRELALIYV